MVTELKTKERVEIRQITLEELGEMVGVPIKIRPWWGSVRDGSTSGAGGVKRWLCPGGPTGNQKRNPEVQNLAHPTLAPDLNIVIWEGPCRLKTQYRTRHGYSHTHAQQVEVKNVARGAMLIVLKISSLALVSQFLIGKDGGSPYVVQVPLRVKTTDEALDWLMPNIVSKAIEDGLDVKRQGDWYFIPRDKPPIHTSYRGNVYGSAPSLKTNTQYRGAALIFNGAQTRHRGSLVIYQTIQGVNGPAPIVKGTIKAADHEPLLLKRWHTGVRNRSHPWRNTRQSNRVDD